MNFQYVALLSFLLPLSAAAQLPSSQWPTIEQLGDAQANPSAIVAGATTIVINNNGEAVVGSPYLDNRWLLARLKMSNNLSLAPVPLKFDVLNQRLLMQPLDRPADSLQLDDRLLAGFELDEPAMPLRSARTRVFRRFTEAPDLHQQAEYVEVLYEGHYILLKRYVKQVMKAGSQKAYGNGLSYDEIKEKNQYYLLRPDKTLVPLKLTLKMLQAAAPELALKTVSGASKASTDAEWAAVLAAAESK